MLYINSLWRNIIYVFPGWNFAIKLRFTRHREERNLPVSKNQCYVKQMESRIHHKLILHNMRYCMFERQWTSLKAWSLATGLRNQSRSGSFPQGQAVAPNRSGEKFFPAWAKQLSLRPHGGQTGRPCTFRPLAVAPNSFLNLALLKACMYKEGDGRYNASTSERRSVRGAPAPSFRGNCVTTQPTIGKVTLE